MDDLAAWLTALRGRDKIIAEKAARSLRVVAKKSPSELKAHGAELLKLATVEPDLRVRWNLIAAIGKLELKPAQRDAAVDWLFERLRDPSPFTRTFALQALFDLSGEDEALRRRWLPIARDFAENGTAAMRARARKLLKSGR